MPEPPRALSMTLQTSPHHRDSVDNAMHIGEVPCARSSLLAGIGAGAGIGFMLGVSLHPVVAGSWAMGTFFAVSTTSWYTSRCSSSSNLFSMAFVQVEDRKELTRKAIESLPKQLRVKNEGE
ncbi:hypothetical protein FB45DRAFT_1020731 [Roridomyces roridus]|uniref:Cytochrome c oxidase assembly protein COX20, mitochondrial n=1 Tax=Roridomyces roridus TaxID=1738132 RepID=A0AAD7CAQ6_9AGAR|nr:hypothetical protein FB45DRAFT_1020731 [Roridomyces roridus]